jgi:hypothetical protein
MVLRRALIALLPVAALTMVASNPAWAPTMNEYAVILGLNRAACTVVDRELKPNEKMVAGPFESRQEAVSAMKQIPECQSSGK